MTKEQIIKQFDAEVRKTSMPEGWSVPMARARYHKELSQRLRNQAQLELDAAKELAEQGEAITKAARARGNKLTPIDENQAKHFMAECDSQISKARALGDAAREHYDQYQSHLEGIEKMNHTNNFGLSASNPFGSPSGSEVIGGAPRWEADPMKGFSSPADFFKAVAHAGGGGSVPDNLKSLAVGSDEAGVYSDAHGGFLVPSALIADVKTVGSVDPLDGLVQRITLAGPSTKIPARVDKNHSTSVSGGLQFYRRAETQTVSSSRMELELINLEANTLMGISYATEEVLADSAVPFMQLLSRSFRDELNSKLMSERLNGAGVGQFLGALASPCLITAAAETGQGANTIVYKNLVNMRARSWGYDRAVWLANPTTLPQLMTMTDPAGRLVWQASARDGEPEVLLSRPIIFDEHLPALGTVGDILLGTWGEYLQGTLGGDLNAEESIHVRFVNHERTFKFWTRNAGAPWWRSVLTPKNGDTLSPFVTLSGTRT